VKKFPANRVNLSLIPVILANKSLQGNGIADLSAIKIIRKDLRNFP
jgi:hypothetical protein